MVKCGQFDHLLQQGARILARPAHTYNLQKILACHLVFFLRHCLPFGSFDTIWEFELVEKCGDKAKVYLMICNTQAARID
jgi:hypothetical protein